MVLPQRALNAKLERATIRTGSNIPFGLRVQTGNAADFHRAALYQQTAQLARAESLSEKYLFKFHRRAFSDHLRHTLASHGC